MPQSICDDSKFHKTGFCRECECLCGEYRILHISVADSASHGGMCRSAVHTGHGKHADEADYICDAAFCGQFHGFSGGRGV